MERWEAQANPNIARAENVVFTQTPTLHAPSMFNYPITTRKTIYRVLSMPSFTLSSALTQYSSGAPLILSRADARTPSILTAVVK